MPFLIPTHKTRPITTQRLWAALRLTGWCLLAGGIGVAPVPVMAGFQLNLPPAAESPAPVVPLEPGQTPPDAGTPTQLPALSETTPGVPARSDLMPVPLAPVATLAPAMPAGMPVTVMPPLVVDRQDQGQPLEGFGRNIPMVVALKQILPANYGFTLEQGVSSATSVSWNGGKPWRAILSDMLAAARLAFQEDGQIIKISPVGLGGRPGMGLTALSREVKPDAPPAVPVVKEAPPVVVEKMPPMTPPPPESTPPRNIEPLQLPSLQPEADIAAADLPALGLPPVNQEKNPESGAASEDKAPIVKDHRPEAKPLALEPALPSIPPGELVAPSMNSMPPLQPTASEVWHAEPGDRLHSIIKKWCARAHVELVWATEYDYPVQASMHFSGSFEEAVRGLLTGFVEARPQPYGRLHDNPAVGQRTLVIETRGNTNND